MAALREWSVALTVPQPQLHRPGSELVLTKDVCRTIKKRKINAFILFNSVFQNINKIV